MLARNEVITNAHILDFPGLLHDPLEVLFDAGRRVAFILGVDVDVVVGNEANLTLKLLVVVVVLEDELGHPEVGLGIKNWQKSLCLKQAKIIFLARLNVRRKLETRKLYQDLKFD